ncbi:hypothetical protein [Microbacterium terricola]|uniref:Uncharacterized protein n=1 Tax=Microbacterium terricola TaxID=344163 RepID=A0ABM8DXT4_9MICO|nr:hypothetical protein [Microbacterium terricola]UYK38930.1 hypothetical protein OAU46_09440 [Microbacterium terricola]BDV30371.1 hypothetical protein Microterr_10310 [Microbacterium terricola]
MSTPFRPSPPLQVREVSACMCVHGNRCSSYAPGHALHLIQARLASATPTEWVDAIVEAADAPTGEVSLRTIDGVAITVWNAAGAAEQVTAGTPVALHARYDVLSLGTRRFNISRLD